MRRARFANGWLKTAQGDWVPLAKARFTASGAEWEAKENIDAGTDHDAFYLATGGEIKMTHQLRTVIDLLGTSRTSIKLLESLPSELTVP
jgi:hypothetical protein